MYLFIYADEIVIDDYFKLIMDLAKKKPLPLFFPPYLFNFWNLILKVLCHPQLHCRHNHSSHLHGILTYLVDLIPPCYSS